MEQRDSLVLFGSVVTQNTDYSQDGSAGSDPCRILGVRFCPFRGVPPSFLTDRLEAPHSVAPPPEIPPLHGLRRRGIEDHDPAQRGQEGHRKRSEPEQPSEEWRREKGTSLTSTVSDGKEPMGHARKRLMQAA